MGGFSPIAYRLILTDNPANRIEITTPPGYDPANYELLKRYIESNPALTLKGVLGINRIPNGKGDANSNGPVSLDFLGANRLYPDGTPELRKEIAQAHLRWAQGLVFFLQNDASVPKALQKGCSRLGPAEGRVSGYRPLAEPVVRA
jgi:FAD dependent oxidoreductase